MFWWRNIRVREKFRKHGDGAVLLALGLAVLAAGALALLAMAETPARNLPAMMGALVMLLLAEWALARAWWRLREQLRARERAMEQLTQARLRAEREAAARARMMAVLSHELRTPISGVLGMAALLRGTSLTPEQTSYVENIDASGRMLLSMVNELLEEARLEAERASDHEHGARREPFDPARLAEEVVELLSPRAHARGLEVASVIDPAVRGEWLGDAPKLKQVLMNLVGNAIKFTTKGGVLVRVARTGEGLHFAVSDTGPGVPEKMRRRIFEPFVRVDDPDTAREGGAGLGLAISRDLLSRMGATLALDNRPGRGATFHFRVPSRPAQADGADGREAPFRRLNGRRLWLVMPDGPTARALHEYVEKHGGEVAFLAPDDLPAHLDDDVDIIVDARMADELQLALDMHGTLPPAARIWLLLAPEERIRLHDLLQDARLAGYLLRPLRRRTLEERLMADAAEGAVTVAARRMRATQQRLKRRLERQEAGPGGGARKGPLVLLAEDDAVNARLLRALLERAGYRVEAFANGAALLERLQALAEEGAPEDYPAAVITDVYMPRMDGAELAQAIRALERGRGLKGLPILALTSGVHDERRQRCLAAGANDVLNKPVDIDAFLDKLAGLIGPGGGRRGAAAE